MKTGLLHPYPGSKKDWHKYPVWDERSYDCVIEPFIGAGHFSHRMLANGRVKDAFVADIDPAVNIVWCLWASDAGCLDRMHVDLWANQIANDIKAHFEIHGLEGVQSWLEDLSKWLWGGDRGNLAIASVLLRKLVFGGVLRCNTKGQLNVALSQDKLEAFSSYEFNWPYFCDSWQVSVSDSWQSCIQRFEESDCQNAIAFVDPPYWLPPKSRPGRRGTGAMTPVYMHHGNPEGQETFDLFINCIDRLLANPRVSRVVATNYISEELCFEVQRLLDKRKLQWWFTPLGTLATMNNGTHRDDCPIEGFWEFGGRRMAGKYEQKSLLEIAA